MPETKLVALPEFQELKSNDEYISMQPYKGEDNKSYIANLVRHNALTFCPYYFIEKSGKGSVVYFHPTSDLCGYKNIVHGGFITTMLDEALAFGVFPNFPSKMGVTVQLDTTYVAPALCSHLYKIVTKTTKVEGRKCWTSGELLRLNGSEPPVLCAKASGFFVEPSKLNLEHHVKK
ncbi:hypothetical protein POMI540_0969 [Schizosaccharomyces pombe]|uniref:Uncharacterized protein C26H8.11c n=1 Tax=Schizosaccharomyces pombe (strain 972 / ATCC 24843) TaxID=284812 RepID=YOUB_SCHPO|nr:uncharacterized protein SPBC26H8.11c [Schizosaccharomyces pombe]O74793.1 RecName: Full=Uncharacterized protein C26H8.11c [Schizosaccharomyces pombe 972h-]CAA21103.1 conserved fungal protein [Schizosaccharomyces pombe]|eukprot:NP_596654.1 uncharacterized protein SPBC26H8.11c [Schizosaccharomyces pombe]